MGFSGRKPHRFLLVMMTTASEGVILPVGGVILEPFPSARFLRVKALSTCWTSDGSAFGVVTFLKVSFVETLLG
jgi:hypothetical protein